MAVLESFICMVLSRITVSPDNVAVPVKLHHGARIPAHILATLSMSKWTGLNQQVTIFKHMGMLNTFAVVPAVYHLSFRVEQSRMFSGD